MFLNVLVWWVCCVSVVVWMKVLVLNRNLWRCWLVLVCLILIGLCSLMLLLCVVVSVLLSV